MMRYFDMELREQPDIASHIRNVTFSRQRAGIFPIDPQSRKKLRPSVALRTFIKFQCGCGSVHAMGTWLPSGAEVA